MKELKLGTVVNISDMRIAPIEEIYIYNTTVHNSAVLYASKKPFALVIMNKEITKVIDVNSGELSIDSLINKVSGLKDFLNN